MFRWEKWDSDLCPICSHHAESTLHVLCCPHPSRLSVWKEQLALLLQWLSSVHTAPDIVTCLSSILASRGGSSCQSGATISCSSAALAQDQIGFFGLMVGRIATAWIPIQASYYVSIGSHCSASLWAVRLCRQLVQFTHAIWLARNQQVLEARCSREFQQARSEILEQFHLGIHSLLPVDQFYVALGPHGFSQERVLNMTLDDQLLWLQALRNARLRGAEQLSTPLGRMRQVMDNYLHPPSPSAS